MKRVLKKDGSCWINLGDTYSGNTIAGNMVMGNPEFNKNRPCRVNTKIPGKKTILKDKCLCMIPQRFAIEMINRGWILRNVIIWHKPSCMPASVKDRFTVDFEYMYFFVKNKKYYFEQQFEPHSRDWIGCGGNIAGKGTHKKNNNIKDIGDRNVVPNEQGRNKRTVWSINTEPFSDAHFAVYPPALIEAPIKAGCPVNGIVLDPFIGSGTTALVAKKLGRNFIGIELNPKDIKIINKRLLEISLLLSIDNK